MRNIIISFYLQYIFHENAVIFIKNVSARRRS